MIVVADTGPILHLHWIDAMAWALPPSPVHVVEEVWREVQKLAPTALRDSRLLCVTASQEHAATLKPFRLDEGERAALSFALSQKDRSGVLVLCDERAARAACSAMSIPVTGSIGLILEAVRMGRASKAEAERGVRELPERGRLHIDQLLIQKVLDTLQSFSK